MKIIYFPKVTVISKPIFIEPPHKECKFLGDSSDAEKLVEYGGRVCYESYHNPANRTTQEYIENIKNQKHYSVIEHANWSLLLEGISRSLSHELVRHRHFSFSQLSQRYVDESDTAFVIPPAIIGNKDLEDLWLSQIKTSKDYYKILVERLYQQYNDVEDKVARRKMSREAARSVLPNATETKIVITGNARTWREMLEKRYNPHADKEIQRLSLEILKVLKIEAPILFSDFIIT